MKSWFQSKTVWFNLLTMAAAIFLLPQITHVISPDTALLAQGIVNIILRVWFTSEPIDAPGNRL